MSIRTMVTAAAAIAVASVYAAGAARADDKKDDDGKDHGAHAHAGVNLGVDVPGVVKGDHDKGDHDKDDDDAEETDAAAAAIVVQRTPEQNAFREKLLAAQHALVITFAHHGGQARATMEDRQAIGVHWRHVMRLVRIRELAEQDKDAATVKRVDSLLEREDNKFRAKAGLAASASAATSASAGAKTTASAAAGAAGKGGAK